MNKFKKFCKFPLLIISAVIFVVSMITLIVVNTIPHGNKYEYKFNELGTNVSFKVDFRDDSMLLFSAYAKSALFDEELSDVEAMYYTKNDDVLFVKSNGVTEKLGKLDSFTLTISYPVLEDKTIDIVLKCKTNINLNISAIVLMGVFGALLIASLIMIIVDVNKNKKQMMLSAETVENNLPPIQPET